VPSADWLPFPLGKEFCDAVVASISTTLPVAFFATCPTLSVLFAMLVVAAPDDDVDVAAGAAVSSPFVASATTPAPAPPPTTAAAAITAAILFLAMFCPFSSIGVWPPDSQRALCDA